jgi:hypothetical protein
MQALAELLAAIVVWMAVATLNNFGIKVEMPKAEPRVERIIRRDSPAKRETALDGQICPQSDAPQARVAADKA